jgi:hypothetical protein
VSGRLLCPSIGSEAQPFTVLAAEPCVLDIGFSPDVPGEHRATLRVETPGGVTYEGRIAGTATAAIVEISPDSEVFPDTDAQTFTVTNVGTTSIDVGDPTPRPIREPVDDVFDIGALECDSGTRTLEPGQSCQVTVTYLGGEESAFLEFEISVTGDPEQLVLGDERVLLIVRGQSPDA